MKTLHIDETSKTPTVSCLYDEGIIALNGISIPEDAFDFFTPVLEWLEEYVKEKKQIEVNIFLVYFNTSSSHMITQILKVLSDNADRGFKSHVKWTFEEDDMDIEDMGLDYQKIFPKLTFTIKSE